MPWRWKANLRNKASFLGHDHKKLEKILFFWSTGLTSTGRVFTICRMHTSIYQRMQDYLCSNWILCRFRYWMIRMSAADFAHPTTRWVWLPRKTIYAETSSQIAPASQSTTRVKPFICTMPMRLDEGWNQIQFNLSDFTRRAYGRQNSRWKTALGLIMGLIN